MYLQHIKFALKVKFCFLLSDYPNKLNCGYNSGAAKGKLLESIVSFSGPCFPIFSSYGCQGNPFVHIIYIA